MDLVNASLPFTCIQWMFSTCDPVANRFFFLSLAPELADVEYHFFKWSINIDISWNLNLSISRLCMGFFF